MSIFGPLRALFNRNISPDRYGPEHDRPIPFRLGPPAEGGNPRDDWPAWTDASYDVVAAGPTRRNFLGALLGLAVAAPAAVPGPGPLERAYRRWLAAIAEVERAAEDDGRHGPYGDPDYDRQELRLHDAQSAEFAARDEMIRLIAEAAGVELGDSDGLDDAEGPHPLAAAREGRNLYLVLADHLRPCGLRPLVVELAERGMTS